MEFELHDRKFRVKKLSAFGQLHLSRRVAPLLPPLAPLIVKITQKAREEREKGEDGPAGSLLSTDVLALAELALPFAEALASMSDEDAERVFTMTLTCVEVLTDPGHNVWMPLWLAGGKAPMVMELDDAAALLPIVVRVIVHNLGNFMDTLLTRREEVGPASIGGISPARKTG